MITKGMWHYRPLPSVLALAMAVLLSACAPALSESESTACFETLALDKFSPADAPEYDDFGLNILLTIEFPDDEEAPEEEVEAAWETAFGLSIDEIDEIWERTTTEVTEELGDRPKFSDDPEGVKEWDEAWGRKLWALWLEVNPVSAVGFCDQYAKRVAFGKLDLTPSELVWCSTREAAVAEAASILSLTLIGEDLVEWASASAEDLQAACRAAFGAGDPPSE